MSVDAAEVRGHLFVVHGDLTRLHCDGFVVPCDKNVNVSDWWTPVLGETDAGDDPGWVKPRHVTGRAGLWIAPRLEKRRIILVDTVTGAPDVDELLDRTLGALSALRDQVSNDRADRVVPLLALPMVGTGEGVFTGRRGEVAHALVAELYSWCSSQGTDVALVLRERSAFVAVQAARAQIPEMSRAQWHDLESGDGAGLIEHADRLGTLAAQGDLSLFVGAGVSVPLGLPSWSELLDRLEAEAKVAPEEGSDLLARAGRLRRLLAQTDFESVMKDTFLLDRYALGHALAAGLRPQRSVTTNYDNALELAMAGQAQDIRVLTRQEAVGHLPWLLKLHGDIEDAETIVLSDQDYADLESWGGALYGVVQTLLMTGHLLFVGFGFADPDFDRLLEEVSEVRRRTKDVEADRRIATAFALTESEAHRYPEVFHRLHMVAGGPDLSPADRTRAARRVEVFLDRVAYTATTKAASSAEYLLDPDYATGLSKADSALAASLTGLADDESEEARLARTSQAWPHVEDLLRLLGRPQGKAGL